MGSLNKLFDELVWLVTAVIGVILEFVEDAIDVVLSVGKRKK
jgi:hypothetical protein